MTTENQQAITGLLVIISFFAIFFFVIFSTTLSFANKALSSWEYHTKELRAIERARVANEICGSRGFRSTPYADGVGQWFVCGGQ